jgi:UDP-N-acetylmuramoyl-L-alanyl-D-glutamate--2,6-diaminopimelate ligase
MTLQELLEGLEFKEIRGPVDVEIRGIAYNSRDIKKDFLFVAVRGFVSDGHDYIEDAVSRGAAAVIAEKAEVTGDIEKLLRRKGLPYIVTSDNRKALAMLASTYFGRPSESFPIVAVTGTNGKTTTGYITRHILKAWGKDTGLLGTNEYILGERTLDAPRTTPESLDIQRYLREMLDNGIEYSVLEVSSHALTLERIEGCAFKIAVFTNFSQDHLDFHGTMERYFSAKSRIFSYLSEDGTAVLNYDDPVVRTLTQSLGCRVITCGLQEGAMLRAVNISDRAVHGGLLFEVRTPEGGFAVESGLIGRFNVYNILMAIGAAYALGIDVETIQRGVRDAEVIKGRFEKINEGQDFMCIVDFAHTEDALEKLIKEARRTTGGRVITVFGCGGDRDRTKRPRMGAVASDLSDFVIVTSDNPRSEEPSEIIRDIFKGIKRDNSSVQPDRTKAIREAVEMAEKGDTLLIAGKGHEDYQEIKGVKVSFSDKEVLIKELRRRQGNYVTNS